MASPCAPCTASISRIISQEAEDAFGRLAMQHEKVSVCGLSLGGLLALNLAARRRVANLILIAPFMTPAGSTFGLPNSWLVGRVPLPRLMGKNVGGPIDDPQGPPGHIAYHAMPAAEMASVVQATRDFAGLEKAVTCPTLIFHGVNDKTSDFAGSLSLMVHWGRRTRPWWLSTAATISSPWTMTGRGSNRRRWNGWLVRAEAPSISRLDEIPGSY